MQGPNTFQSPSMAFAIDIQLSNKACCELLHVKRQQSNAIFAIYFTAKSV